MTVRTSHSVDSQVPENKVDEQLNDLFPFSEASFKEINKIILID